MTRSAFTIAAVAFLCGTAAATSPQAFGNTQFTFSGLVATGSLTELDFGFVQNAAETGFWYLDDVSVTQGRVGVPEPFSTLLFALLFAGMVSFGRFRTKTV